MISKIIKRTKYIIKISIIKIMHFNNIYIKDNWLKINIPSIKNLNIESGKIVFLGSATVSSNSVIGVRKKGIITIGKNFFSNRNFTCICYDKITFGDNVSIGPNVCIYDHDHKYNENGKIKNEYTFGEVIIGNNVWIGAGAIILKGTKIGENTIIGAGAVVSGNIPANSLVKSNRELLVTKLRNKR